MMDMIHQVSFDDVTHDFYDEKSARKYIKSLKLAGKIGVYNCFERGCLITCHHCQERFYESDPRITLDNIEENERGQDVVSFNCPKCGKETTSLRLG
jgi:hypothetical protein